MSISLARQAVANARKELEKSREKQAAEEKKASALDKEANAKQRSAGSTRSASMRDSYIKQAAKKREEATAARGHAARHSTDAAKAQKKVHVAEAKLREEEQREAKKLTDQRSAADKRATLERQRADRLRDTAHRREVAGLRARIDEQEQLLAAAPWQQVPETITVLFIASSPEDQDGLRIDKEMREIQQKVRLADHRDALRFEYAVAAQPADLLQRLNEVKPDVVHFSGHSDAAGLAMEDNDGFTRVLTTDELATMLSVSSRRIRLAVFNSCESTEHAAAAVRHLDAAIGIEQPIGDAAAQSFAGQLYSSIASASRSARRSLRPCCKSAWYSARDPVNPILRCPRPRWRSTRPRTTRDRSPLEEPEPGTPQHRARAPGLPSRRTRLMNLSARVRQSGPLYGRTALSGRPPGAHATVSQEAAV